MLTGAVIAGAVYGVLFFGGTLTGIRVNPTACLTELACFAFIGAAVGGLF